MKRTRSTNNTKLFFIICMLRINLFSIYQTFCEFQFKHNSMLPVASLRSIFLVADCLSRTSWLQESRNAPPTAPHCLSFVDFGGYRSQGISALFWFLSMTFDILHCLLRHCKRLLQLRFISYVSVIQNRKRRLIANSRSWWRQPFFQQVLYGPDIEWNEQTVSFTKLLQQEECRWSIVVFTCHVSKDPGCVLLNSFIVEKGNIDIKI